MVLVAQKMLNEAFNDGDIGVVDLSGLGCDTTTHMIKWGEGVQAGVIQIEAADRANYTGQWAPILTVTFDASATLPRKQEYVSVPGTYAAMRHRVDGVIEGGVVSTRIDGSGDW